MTPQSIKEIEAVRYYKESNPEVKSRPWAFILSDGEVYNDFSSKREAVSFFRTEVIGSIEFYHDAD